MEPRVNLLFQDNQPIIKAGQFPQDANLERGAAFKSFGVLFTHRNHSLSSDVAVKGMFRAADSVQALLRICLAMTRRWISLVPSPMVQSLESRQNFSGG